MNKVIIKKLFESFNVLELAIISAKKTIEQRPDAPLSVLERLHSYNEILCKQRELAETARRGLYLRKPGKSRTLDAIAEARRVVSAENGKAQERMRRVAEADLKLNPYKYDLSNFERMKGAVPAEHLLILAAEGADTTNISKSDRKSLNERTALAHKVTDREAFYFYFYFCCAVFHMTITLIIIVQSISCPHMRGIA